MSDLISRKAAIEAIEELTNRYFVRKAVLVMAQDAINNLSSAQPKVPTCDGCRNVGTYDTDFPCSVCIRREKDYYEQE